MAKGKAVTREWSNVPMNDLTPSVHTDAQSYDQCEDVKVSWVASGIKEAQLTRVRREHRMEIYLKFR